MIKTKLLDQYVRHTAYEVMPNSSGSTNLIKMNEIRMTITHTIHSNLHYLDCKTVVFSSQFGRREAP